MRFQEELLKKVQNRYQEEHFLRNVFEELKDHLYDLFVELSEYEEYGLELDYQNQNEEYRTLRISERSLTFYLLLKEKNDQHIQVSFSDGTDATVIDKIKLKNEGSSSIYAEHKTEEAFQKYLEAAFGPLTF